MGRNYYAEAIEILKNSYDGLALNILFEIAKVHPKAVVDAKARIDRADEPQWVKECRRLAADGRKIDAIKLCREKTKESFEVDQMSLIEAKAFVEYL
jgi:ribosomal protein L7/L12